VPARPAAATPGGHRGHCPPPVLAELERRAAAGETVYALARELLPQTLYATEYEFRKFVYTRRWGARRAERGAVV
jgi:hypothetical protein